MLRRTCKTWELRWCQATRMLNLQETFLKPNKFAKHWDVVDAFQLIETFTLFIPLIKHFWRFILILCNLLVIILSTSCAFNCDSKFYQYEFSEKTFAFMHIIKALADFRLNLKPLETTRICWLADTLNNWYMNWACFTPHKKVRKNNNEYLLTLISESSTYLVLNRMHNSLY